MNRNDPYFRETQSLSHGFKFITAKLVETHGKTAKHGPCLMKDMNPFKIGHTYLTVTTRAIHFYDRKQKHIAVIMTERDAVWLKPDSRVVINGVSYRRGATMINSLDELAELFNGLVGDIILWKTDDKWEFRYEYALWLLLT